jgi:DNA-binding CsgD family transcriptional regulator
MHASLSHRQTEHVLLQSLCHCDPTAWCFIPLEEYRITNCSDAFLRLWRLPSSAAAPSDSRSLDLRDVGLRQAFSALGVSSDILLDIAGGHTSAVAREATLIRNDDLRVRVQWSTVLTDDGLPAGRLLQFTLETDLQILTSLLERATAARHQMQVLSPRETHVVQLLFDGLTNKEIARAAEISEKTVEKHRARIMQKLRVSSMAELVRLIAQAKLVERGPGLPTRSEFPELQSALAEKRQRPATEPGRELSAR